MACPLIKRCVGVFSMCGYNLVFWFCRINGADFYLSLTDVNRHPNSLLGHPSKRAQYYNPTTGSYFFPRNQDIFPAIHRLYRYPTTVLKRPPFISMERFVEEIEFFQLSPQVTTNQPINQSKNQRISESINQWINESIDPRINESTNQ